MHTAENPTKKPITDKPTAATNADNTQDKKNADNTTTDTTTKTRKDYNTNTSAHEP